MKNKEILRQVYEKELMDGERMTDDLWDEMCEDDDWLKVSLKAMKKVKNLTIHSVINWVAVKDNNPKKGQEVIIDTGKYGLHICGYNSPLWKKLKPTHWADINDIKRPCL